MAMIYIMFSIIYMNMVRMLDEILSI